MTQPAKHHLSSRVFKLNVGFLLNDGPAHSQDSAFDFPRVRVTDDLILEFVRGPLRLSRTKEGILVQAQFTVGIDDECYRCLTPVLREDLLKIEELFAFNSPGHAEFSISDDAVLDLAPLLRDEVLLAMAQGVLCQVQCKGLCPECGVNLNHESCDCSAHHIDPRLSKLKLLLENSR